ncbi:MAG: serine/threonine protein kinase [Acidobacteria bacterium]|nr:serine/threonine protein kinase [Acidobacteriota bacterium]
MAQERTVIARHRDTPSGLQDSGPSTTRLPEELLREHVRRIGLFAAVIGSLWGLGLFMDVVMAPLTWSAGISVRAVSLEITGIAVAAVMVWYVRYCRRTTVETNTNVSFGYLVFNGVGVAVLNTWNVPGVAEPVIHLSWVTVGILVFSMIVPASPRKMLTAALITASMDPLALLVAYLAGHPVATVPHAVTLALPNYACALVAVLPSRVLQRVGRRLRKASELGGYHLVELLGTGGMGEVWRAEHHLLARDAAIKLVRPELLGARDEAEMRLTLGRFEREAQATAQLSSPHTIQLFDFGVTEEGTFYYVMELLAGRDMKSMVREFGPMPADRAFYLLRQVTHSLAEAHARGLVHCDIKPANIYVCRMGLEYDFVKVLDFGLVKSNRRPGDADTLVTLDHTTTGTPAYMAPETILGDADVDQRADVYALGCVAYYLLTGQLVFEADTPMKTLMHHLHTQPVPPSQRTELPIPLQLDELVMACLRKDPNLRPQNAEELFRLACECRGCEGWSQGRARTWWEVHMRDFTGPLAFAKASEPVHGVAMV